VSAPECRRRLGELVPVAKRQTCIEALADGWIGAPDLCPACTRAFMAALDGIDEPLVWHRNYQERARR
jgi:hypothetical protein